MPVSIDTQSTPESQRIQTEAQSKQRDPAQSARQAGSTEGITAPPAENQEQLKLAEFLDVAGIQELMDDLYELTGIGVGIVDLQGKVLVSNGWQDICTRFHRVHPEARRNCIESDTLLSCGMKAGEQKLYKCKNNLWDMATPIIIDSQHVGNIFLGQFFFDDEPVDLELFRDQARRYGFDETSYLEALERVPRWPRDKVCSVFKFYTRFADMLAQLSYGGMMLSRSLDEREGLLKAIREREAMLDETAKIARIGGGELDVHTMQIAWTTDAYRIKDIPKNRTQSLEHAIEFCHPDDREAMGSAFRRAIANGEPYDLDLRFDTAAGRHMWARMICHPQIVDGKVVKLKGIFQDITELKKAELQQREHMQELKRWHNATMGREGRVLELKKEVNKLLRQAGLPERYPSAEI